MSLFSPLDDGFMSRAIDLARQGEGYVEPNPMVGCLIVEGGKVLAEGWHRRFGGPHAEVDALAHLRGKDLGQATMYVTLEPCAHHGKTPPCVDAIIMSHIGRVVIGIADPDPRVSGAGIEQLRGAGIQVEVGCREVAIRELNAPYLHRLATGRPWVIAKWAMSWDGKIATAAGESQWISGEQARAIVHQLRGRMDGIAVGSKTAARDDPRLTARPSGPRTPARIVFSASANLAHPSVLVSTARQVPTIVVCEEGGAGAHQQALVDAGCKMLAVKGLRTKEGLDWALRRLAEGGMTNLLLEGGGEILGEFFDRRRINEVHLFLAPLILGGREAPGPVAGGGIHRLGEALRLVDWHHETIGEDVYLRGVIPAG